MHDNRRTCVAVSTLVILAVFFLCGCPVKTPECVFNGQAHCVSQGNFTGQWYDYYERALSCIEGECYDSAVADLGEAIRRRDRDQRRARTMGMHFVDYFPHREKGLAHYFLGQYEDAKSELEVSIGHYPSEKAHFYLDKVRQQLMEIEQKPVSRPVISIDTPKISENEPVWTKDDPVVVSGASSDAEQYIAEIILAGTPVFIESSGKHVLFSENLVLDQGRHDISIVARNLMGGETERHIVVHVDRVGPVIAVSSFTPGNHVRGRVYDESGDIRLFADGKQIASGKEATLEFDVPLAPNNRSVVLTATDRLGNETKLQMGPDFQSDASEFLLAGNQTAGISDVAPVLATTGKTGPAAPEITLKDWSDHETVFRESVRIQIDVNSGADVSEFSVNQATRPIGGLGQSVTLTHFARLRQGENVLRISARDITGKTGEKEIVITRKIPEAFKLGHRYGLALHPFEQSGTSENALFHFRFLEDLLFRGRFRVFIRGELEDMLDSPPYRDTLCKVVRQGDVDAVMLGVVYGTRAGVEIAARLVDIESRETIATADVYADSDNAMTMAFLAKKLSEKFHRYLPIMDGGIVRVGEKEIVAEPEKWLPAKGKIVNGWPMIIYRNTHPENMVRGSDSVIVCEEGSAGQTNGGKIAVSAENCANNEIGTEYRVISR